MCAQYNRKDKLYERAKTEGYLSRAAYKLIELDTKYGILKKGQRVLDLGCWPGSWLQVVSEKISNNGLVVGIDLVSLEQSFNSNVRLITGDVGDSEVIVQALNIINKAVDHKESVSTHHKLDVVKFDVVLSDMSPKLTGIVEADIAQTVNCAELALNTAKTAMKKGGILIIKMFKSQDSEDFIKRTKKNFDKIQRCGLESTRITSNEFYFVGFGFRV